MSRFLDLEAVQGDIGSDDEEKLEGMEDFIDDDLCDETFQEGLNASLRTIGPFGDEDSALDTRTGDNGTDDDEERLTAEIIQRARDRARQSRGTNDANIPENAIDDEDLNLPITDDDLLRLVHTAAKRLWGRERGHAGPKQSDFVERFSHGQWVRPLRGLYAGDLALVWSPLTAGKFTTTSVSNSKNLTVLLPARIQTTSSEPEKTLGKRKRLVRPPAKRVESYAIQTARKAGNNAYENKTFFHGLLVARMKNSSIRRSKPQYAELQPFIESGFNVRPWKRYLAQDTLRFGDRVIVHGGPHHGRMGVVNTCCPGMAVIMAVGENNDDSPTRLEVDMRSLDRHFLIGDNVRTIPRCEGEIVRYGQVVNIEEVSVEQLKRRKREVKRTVKHLKEEEEGMKVALIAEMRRLQDIIWGSDKRPILYDGHGVFKTEDDSKVWPSRGAESSSDSEAYSEDDGINTAPLRIAPMYDYSCFGERYIEITVFDASQQKTFVANHVELEFYEAAHSELTTVVPSKGFRTDVKSEVTTSFDNIGLCVSREGPEGNQSFAELAPTSQEGCEVSTTNGCRNIETVPRRDACFTGRDRTQFHKVLVFKGPYKSYIGVCQSIGREFAWVQLTANGAVVEIPLNYLWNMTQNTSFSAENKGNTLIARLAASYEAQKVETPRRLSTPLPDIDTDISFHKLEPPPTNNSDHWLYHPAIVDVMNRVHLYLRVKESVLTLTEFQVLSLHTLTPPESSRLQLPDRPHTVNCTYKRRKGEVTYRAIPTSEVSVSQPRMKSIAIIVKDPGSILATDPSNKRWSKMVDGNLAIGKCFDFLKRDLANREQPSAGHVAALRVREPFHKSIPVGKFVRVPIDFVCRAEFVPGVY